MRSATKAISDREHGYVAARIRTREAEEVRGVPRDHPSQEADAEEHEQGPQCVLGHPPRSLPYPGRRRVVVRGSRPSVAERAIALNKNLNVPCGWARRVISGPKRYRLPSPTRASAIVTPPCKYSCPQAHPLISGAFESNQAKGVTSSPAIDSATNTGLLFKRHCQSRRHARRD